LQINSTQAIGLLSFVSAALAAATAFGVAGQGRRSGRRTWAIIASIYVLLAVEVFAMTRHQFNRVIGGWLKIEGSYAERGTAQVVLVIITVVVAALITGRVVLRAPTRRLSIARGSTAAIVALFAVGSVSLHASDAILYQSIGPVLLIGWLWFLCGFTTAAAARPGLSSPRS